MIISFEGGATSSHPHKPLLDQSEWIDYGSNPKRGCLEHHMWLSLSPHPRCKSDVRANS